MQTIGDGSLDHSAGQVIDIQIGFDLSGLTPQPPTIAPSRTPLSYPLASFLTETRDNGLALGQNS
jgi:hypothetical protein